jgi:hypothetical protein
MNFINYTFHYTFKHTGGCADLLDDLHDKIEDCDKQSWYVL